MSDKKPAYQSTKRMKELYDLYYASQLQKPYYETEYYFEPTKTAVYGGYGDINNIGYERLAGISQDLGPLNLGFAREKAMDDWTSKYSVGVGGKNWNIGYERGNGDYDPSHTFSLNGRVGKANINASYTKQGDYRGYDVGVGGKLGKLDARLDGHKDNMGNRKIYAMLGGRF